MSTVAVVGKWDGRQVVLLDEPEVIRMSALVADDCIVDNGQVMRLTGGRHSLLMHRPTGIRWAEQLVDGCTYGVGVWDGVWRAEAGVFDLPDGTAVPLAETVYARRAPTAEQLEEWAAHNDGSAYFGPVL